MTNRRSLVSLSIGIGLALFAAPPLPAKAAQEDPAPADAKEFDQQFRPLFAKHCVSCHSGAKAKGNLRLDTLKLDLGDAAARMHWATVIERL